MRRRGRLAATVGLVLLVLVDVALIVAALRLSSRVQAADPVVIDTAAVGGGQTAAPRPVSTGEPTTATATATPTTKAEPLQVLLSAVDGTFAWRAKAGRCGAGGAAVSLTVDGGTTWRGRTAPFPVLSRIQPTDASRAFAVGASAACELGVKTTLDGGATWPGSGVVSDTLARDPKDPTRVRTPGGRTASPCDDIAVVDLSRSSANAAQALCADGSIRGTTDDGATWGKVADQPGAVALDARVVGNDVRSYVALVGPGCEGVTVRSVSGGTVTGLACVAIDTPAAGTVAISVPKPDIGWLLVGDTIWRSSGGLKNWTRTGG